VNDFEEFIIFFVFSLLKNSRAQVQFSQTDNIVKGNENISNKSQIAHSFWNHGITCENIFFKSEKTKE